MANRKEVMDKVMLYKTSGQDVIRRDFIHHLSDHTGRDTISYFAAYNTRVPVSPGMTSIGHDDIQGFMTCMNKLHGDKLDLILHSPGGSSEAAEQIVQYLRSKYSYIRAIVPQFAMSAATMIACACDEIVMGKESAIGPIDPQMAVYMPGGVMTYMPAHSVLADVERAKADIATNPAYAAIWVPKLSMLPNGFFDLCTRTIANTKKKVAEWLNAYMFRGEDPAIGNGIADWLGDFDAHNTHGHPIGYNLAKSKGLKVTCLEDDQVLQDGVLSVYHANLVTFEVSNCVKAIENHLGVGHYIVAGEQDKSI